MSPIFSPSLTASSSSSRYIDKMPELDLPLEHDGEMPDFSELLNFDDLDSGVSSHSPTTISPNRTPSPLAHSHSPFAVSPLSYDFLNNQANTFSFDFPLEKAQSQSGPSNAIDYTIPTDFVHSDYSSESITVKQEPVEFGWPNAILDEQRQQPMQQPAIDVATNISTLPADQQFALQQLMMNIVNYQNQFGMDFGSNQTAAPQQQTIEPSLLFSHSPSMSSSSNANTFASYTTPSSSTSHSQVHSQVQSPAEQKKRPSPDFVLDDIAEEEPLRSISADEQPTKRVRADSVFSLGGDIDAKLDQLVPLPDIFSAGKGKGGKKGGGLSSVVKMDDEDLDDDDSWRPSPEEYKKLSSKEKRQLRNKLSARAFRTRRKDYIGTLEGHIKDRDTVIDAIKAELVNSRTEAQDLRRELSALKSSTMEILHPESAVKSSQSPALISALAMTPSLPAATASPRKAAPTPVFNPRKDLPSSSSLMFGNDNIMGGGSTICHTLLTPEVVLPSSPTSPLNLPRANMNPLLNDADSRGTHLASTANGRDIASGTFSDWSENNAFSLRSMDSYRMQMWSRLAREAQAEKAGLAADIRPKFFVEPKSPASSSTSTSTAEADSAANLAGVAALHITSKLASSFWSAFATPHSHDHRLDTDKLTAVVTGRARLRVVDEKSAAAAEDALAAAFDGLRLQAGLGSIGKELGRISARGNPLGAFTNFLGLAVMPTRV